MKSTSKHSILFLTAFTLILFGCNGVEKQVQQNKIVDKQEIAEEAVKTWMIQSNEYPHYKPVVFGDLTPRYERSSRTLQLTIEIANEEAISKTNGNKQRLDSLKSEIAKYRNDLLGYLLPHKFQELNMAGETINRELLFFLDTTLKVASALPPESFDYILDEKVFFRPDSDFE
jgi:hypothetical protein